MLEIDRSTILNHTSKFENLHGSQITILGGTGFVGTWILEAIDALNDEFNLNISISLITRDEKKAQNKIRDLRSTKIRIQELNLSVSPNVELDSADFYIHGATPAVSKTGYSPVANNYDSTINGARLISDSIKKSKQRGVALHLSSGAVYGIQPLSMPNRPEIEIARINDNLSPYAKAKIEAENIILEAQVTALNPRLFTFFGPGILLDEHFAIGNFMGNIQKNEKIIINGNINTIRSYLYPTDLVIWLLAILSNPVSGVINIGSENSIRINDLAVGMNSLFGGVGVERKGINQVASNYVPQTNFVKDYYGLIQEISLDEGFMRWKRWLDLQNVRVRKPK